MAAPDGWCEDLDYSGLEKVYGESTGWDLRARPLDTYEECTTGNGSFIFHVFVWLYPSESVAESKVEDRLSGISYVRDDRQPIEGSWDEGEVAINDEYYYLYGRSDNLIIEVVNRCSDVEGDRCVNSGLIPVAEDLIEQILTVHSPSG